jgi:hypothetical protein
MLVNDVSKLEVHVVFCEPMPAYHLEVLKVLIINAALRKLKRMVQLS